VDGASDPLGVSCRHSNPLAGIRFARAATARQEREHRRGRTVRLFGQLLLFHRRIGLGSDSPLLVSSSRTVVAPSRSRLTDNELRDAAPMLHHRRVHGF